MTTPIAPPGDHSKCPYCGSPTSIEDSKRVYGTSYGMILLCSAYPKCDSFVGIHRDTDIPKGTLANNVLRRYRKQAHGVFDVMWREGSMHRRQAYQQLAKILGVPPAQAHIGWCNAEQCQVIIAALTPKKAAAST